MRVAFVTAGMAGGGAERVISSLSDGFIKNNIDVSIIVMGTNNSIAYDLNKKTKIFYLQEWGKNNPNTSLIRKLQKKITVNIDPLTEYEQIKQKYDASSRLLIRFLKKNQFDYIISLLTHDNINVALCTHKQHAKTIISEGTYPDRPEYSLAFKQYRNEVYAKADIRVFQTKQQKEYFPLNIKENSFIIGNPISSIKSQPFEGVREKYIVNFCRLDKPKNLNLLINAFSRVSQTYDDYQLKIYGEGPLKEELEERIGELSLKQKVFILPFSKNIHELVNDASMFVTSSDYEGLSNSLMEAMALGMPVIATDCLGGGAAELIENNKNGILVERDNCLKLARAMQYLIDNPEKAQQLGRNALKIREIYSSDVIVDLWLKVLKV